MAIVAREVPDGKPLVLIAVVGPPQNRPAVAPDRHPQVLLISSGKSGAIALGLEEHTADSGHFCHEVSPQTRCEGVEPDAL